MSENLTTSNGKQTCVTDEPCLIVAALQQQIAELQEQEREHWNNLRITEDELKSTRQQVSNLQWVKKTLTEQHGVSRKYIIELTEQVKAANGLIVEYGNLTEKMHTELQKHQEFMEFEGLGDWMVALRDRSRIAGGEHG